MPLATILDDDSRLDLILFQADRTDPLFDQDAHGLHPLRLLACVADRVSLRGLTRPARREFGSPRYRTAGRCPQ